MIRIILRPALGVALVVGLAGCGGHSRLHAGALPIITLERLPTSEPGQLERVVVAHGTLRVQVAARSPNPAWKVVRQVRLSRADEQRLAGDARAVRGWNKKPGPTCLGLPPGANVAELLVRVGRNQTLCAPETARALIAFLGTYLPGSPRV